MRKLMVWLYALLLLVVGVSLRVWNMTAEAASYDEIAASLGAIRGVGEYLASPQLAHCPPLYYLILHPLSWVGGSLWLMRLPSVIAGALVPVLLFVLGRRLFGSRAAGIGAFLLAVNPLHVFYSQEVKSAALFTLFLVVTFYFLIRSAEKSKFADWALFDVFAVATVYLNRNGFFLLGMFLLIHLWKVFFFRDVDDPRRRRRSRLLGALLYNYVVVFACCLPWFLASVWKGGMAEPRPVPFDLLRVFSRFYTFGMLEPKPIRPLVALALFVLVMPPLIGTVRTLNFRSLAALAGMGLGLLVLYGAAFTPVSSFSPPREGMLLVPFFALGLGILIGRCNAYVRTSLFVLFSLTFSYATVRQGLPGSQQKTPWDVINNVIAAKARPTDLLVYWPDHTLQIGEYYFGNRYKMVSATDLFERWGEQAMAQSAFFIVSKFPSPSLHLYTFPGALHQYSRSEILRMNGLDCVIQARNLNMLNLKLWYANPHTLNVVDEPSSDTQFLFTAADAVESKDPARSLFRDPQFHWNVPGMCYELNGRRIIWTKDERTDLELPVALTPGNYILKLHCSPRFEQPEFNRDYERTVELSIRTGEERKKLFLDKETVVRVPFTTDREKRKLPVHIEVSPVQKIDRPSHMTFGIKIYSIGVDQATPEGPLP